MYLGQHHVGVGVDEIALALHRRQLGGVAEDEHFLAVAEQVQREVLVDHGHLVDDHQVGQGDGAVVVQLEHGLAGLGVLDRLVDQAVDRAGAGAALLAQHQAGFAGEGAEQHRAFDVAGNLLRQRGLAATGEAEKTEDLWPIGRGQPLPDGLDGRLLLGTPAHTIP
ncbi:hypothetical protein D3C76_972230 [compost metagenome]